MEKNICPNCHEENLSKARYCTNCGFEIPVTPSTQVTGDAQPITPTKKKNNKLLIGIIVGILFLALLITGGLVGIRSCKKFVKNNESVIVDKVLIELANQTNKSCPIMIDQYTRLDNLSALPNKKLRYNYTIIDLPPEKLVPDTLDKYIRPIILSTIKTDSRMNQLKQLNTTFIYSYKNEDGDVIHTIVITPKEYKSPQ